MTKANNVTAALTMARAEFQLVAVGDRQWQLQSYDERAGAWRAGPATSYAMARAGYSEGLAEIATQYLTGADSYDVALATSAARRRIVSGRARDIVREAARIIEESAQ